jgi:AraC-like DNA-binding protein
MYLLNVSVKILTYVCGLGILQGILLAALIYFHPKSDKSVNVFLALYIFCTSAIMSMPFIMQAVGWKNSHFTQPLPLFAGPFLYFYIRSFRESITWRKAWPHFIFPCLFFFIAYWNISFLSDKYPGTPGSIPKEVLNAPTTVTFQLLKTVQQIIYYFLAWKTLRSYQRSIRHLFSETSRIDLNWAKFLVNGYLVLITTFLVIFPLITRYPEHVFLLILINMAVAVPYIYTATVKGFLQHTIWQVQPGTDKQTIVEEIHKAEEIETKAIDTSKQRTEKPGLNDDRVGELVKRITALMEKDKLYQETELTLHQLAGKLQVPTYQVSLALNDGMKKNFYDLINGYRVEEAKRLLLDSKNRNYTILSVGFEAGFNSKTTFNTVFKKFTGLTPTEFRDKQRNESAIA